MKRHVLIEAENQGFYTYPALTETITISPHCPHQHRDEEVASAACPMSLFSEPSLEDQVLENRSFSEGITSRRQSAAELAAVGWRLWFSS